MTQIYNDPAGGAESSIGKQFRTFYYQKKALKEAAKEQYFSQMSSTTNMPKNMGKTIKKYHYMPLLDDRNINDQGINAAGVSTVVETTFEFTKPEGTETFYVVGEGANAAAAVTAAKAASVDFFKNNGLFTTDYATSRAALLSDGWTVLDDTDDGDGAGTAAVVAESGNLYGSSKDVGTIQAKLPALSETGGRVNRVGFTRLELEGSIEKFGFFEEYTQESLDFDTDEQLEEHVNREMIMGANEITEDALQIDLLNSAGVVRFGGEATATAEVTGNNGSTASVATYNDLMRLAIDLDNNRCPKNTKIITGSRLADTKVINGARYMFIGSELIPTIKKMTDSFGNPAFIDAKHYAAAGDLARGEIGSIDQFRIVVVPEMQHWAGAGATVTTNDGYRESNGKYDVFPMLVVGSESFTTIGFQTDGKSVKFKVMNKKPGMETADRNDPYGEMGFMSIKWYYGILIERPERIAVVKCVAEW